MTSEINPALKAVSVTPNDSTTILETSCLYVGTGGDVKVTMSCGLDVTFPNVQDGTFMPIKVQKVFATGTAASDIVAMYS